MFQKGCLTDFTKKEKQNYTERSEIISEYIPQEEIKNLIQEDLPFIKAENKSKNITKFKLPDFDLLKTPSKKERENLEKSDTHDPEFLEKILFLKLLLTLNVFCILLIFTISVPIPKIFICIY